MKIIEFQLPFIWLFQKMFAYITCSLIFSWFYVFLYWINAKITFVQRSLGTIFYLLSDHLESEIKVFHFLLFVKECTCTIKFLKISFCERILVYLHSFENWAYLILLAFQIPAKILTFAQQITVTLWYEKKRSMLLFCLNK